MSTSASPTAVAGRAARLSKKQILSLFGLVPLGVYVVFHLWTNLYSLAGEKAFNERLEATRNSPGFIFLEIFGLGLPILAHTIIGLVELFRSRPNNAAYGYFDNLKYLLQRISAIGLALFIGAHVWLARIRPSITPDEYTVGGHETWAGMHHAYNETVGGLPITLIVYALGLLGVSYHLANGVYTFGIRWGLAISPAGRARMQWLSGVLFVVLLGMSYAAVWGFQPFSE